MALPEPYYDKDGITIYHGDCREIVPFIEGVDVVLTDPPYGISETPAQPGHYSKGHIRDRHKGAYAGGFADTAEYLCEITVPVIRDLISRVGCVVVTPGNKHFQRYPQPDSFGVFYQPASVGIQRFGNTDAQPIFYYGKNALGRNMGVPCSYTLTEQPEDNGHPCPKPIRAWRKLLSNVSLPGQIVLDPFMGSGTTLRAAKDLGRRAIGIEIEEKYCEIAANRLRQEVLAFT